MIDNVELTQEVNDLVAAAEASPEATADLKVLAVRLWTNFDEFSLEELEDILRDTWRSRGLPFTDNGEL